MTDCKDYDEEKCGGCVELGGTEEVGCYKPVNRKKDAVAKLHCSDRVSPPACPLKVGDKIRVSDPAIEYGIVKRTEWIEKVAHGVKPYWRITATGYKLMPYCELGTSLGQCVKVG